MICPCMYQTRQQQLQPLCNVHLFFLEFRELSYRNINTLDINDEKRLFVKSKIQDIGLSSFRIYNEKDHRFDNISDNEYKTFHELKDNSEFIFGKVLFEKENVINGLNRVQLHDLLTLATRQFLFIFNKQFYCQTDGVGDM